MLPLEKFFAFSFISVFAVSLLAIWWRYLPTLINFYRQQTDNNQPEQTGYYHDYLNL